MDSAARPRAVTEIAGLVLWFLVFTWLHSAAGKDAAAATANALALQGLETDMHLNIERGLNGWLSGQELLSHLAVYIYRLYYLAVIGVLVWVFIRHASVYRHVRRTMIAMTVLILPVYWLIPMSPPRLAMPGIVDIVARYDIVSSNGGNHYSAMPSLHVGWALWCAYAMSVTGSRVAWIFPAVMIAIVLTTGNHYVLDVVGSVVLLGLSIGVAKLWGRLCAGCDADSG